jgi:hypothetical protein
MGLAAPLILFGLWLFSRRKHGASLSPWMPSSSVHHAHAGHPSTGPAAFPVPPGELVPASMPSGPTFGAGWVPYDPLNQAVIARAEQLLRDASAPHEVIEQDPAGAGKVRYLKLNAPPGHWTVTAWRPTLLPPGAAPSPATPIPTIDHVEHPGTAAERATGVPTLRKGMNDKGLPKPYIHGWQAFLLAHGFIKTKPDGAFGKETEAGTKAFQKKQGIRPDGVVGPETRAHAGSLLI